MSKNMRPLNSLLSVILLLCACASSSRLNKSDTDAINTLRNQIDQVLQDSSLYQTRTGIKIVSLETDEVFYSGNSQQLFHPASNMKLLTTAAALTKLGPNFKFKTVLYADTSAVADSVIHGNLYLKGFANPDLTSDDLKWMVGKLKNRGIKKITGDLIYDETYLDDLYSGSGWMWDDVSGWYWAPISALTVNDNCISLTVKPGAAIGYTLLVQIEPETSYMRIENFGLTVDSLDTVLIKQFKVERKWRPPENSVVIEGGRELESKERTYVIDVVDGSRYTATLVTELLREENIGFSGQIVSRAVPDTALTLVEHFSEPLTSAIINTNKISDNLSAELILKTLGAETFGSPGTSKKGISAIHQFFHKIGVDTTTYELADGSGVSRYNIVTPDLLIHLLQTMHKNFQVQAEFKTSLPIAGVDGTLDNRMLDTAAQGKLRAKTGSLRGVSSLSGYTTTADGEPLAFSMIMEHFVVKTSKIRAIQDRIGHLISSFSRTTNKMTKAAR